MLVFGVLIFSSSTFASDTFATNSIALADDNTVQSLKQQVGQYVVEFQHDHTITAGDPVWFNFFLYENDLPTPFTYVKEVATLNNKVVSQTNIRRVINEGTGVIVDFPQEGEYQLALSYYSTDTLLAQTTFNFTVEKAPMQIKSVSDWYPYTFYAVLACLLGIIIGYTFFKIRSIEKENNDEYQI